MTAKSCVYDVMKGSGNYKSCLEGFCVILSSQTARITQPSMAAYSKLIMCLAVLHYVLVTPEIRNKELSGISQSCCFTSPTKSMNCAGISLGCHDRGMVIVSRSITRARCRLPLKVLAHETRRSLAYTTLQTHVGVVLAFA